MLCTGSTGETRERDPGDAWERVAVYGAWWGVRECTGEEGHRDTGTRDRDRDRDRDNRALCTQHSVAVAQAAGMPSPPCT